MVRKAAPGKANVRNAGEKGSDFVRAVLLAEAADALPDDGLRRPTGAPQSFSGSIRFYGKWHKVVGVSTINRA